MKPRTKREKEAVELSQHLPPISEKQKQYGYGHCFEKKAAVKSLKKHTYYCLECGNVFEDDSTTKHVTCPHCHNKLLTTGVRKYNVECDIYQIVTVAGNYQVIRNFIVTKITQWKKPASYFMYECVRTFMQPGKQDIIIARRISMNPYYLLFSQSSDMTIKYDNHLQYSPYYFNASAVYPHMNLLPIYRRNGFTAKLLRKGSVSKALEYITKYPQYETIVKTKRYDLYSLKKEDVLRNWPQIRLAIRHKYYPKDVSMWIDTIEMVKNIRLDPMSPKYVLPKDLQAMHDRCIILRERLKKQKELETMKIDEKAFLKAHKKYLGICIVSDGITIKPLQNAEEFYEEGKAMHHCVATYLTKKQSLILSARSGNVRLATIEVDLTDFSILQCRAKFNKMPEKYDIICDIINRNIKLFKTA